jgi:hypothetical protein
VTGQRSGKPSLKTEFDGAIAQENTCSKFQQVAGNASLSVPSHILMAEQKAPIAPQGASP